MLLYFLIIIISSCQALEPLDYGRLMATEEYKKLENATQAEKDKRLKDACNFSRYSRQDVVLALLSGATPALMEHYHYIDVPVMSNDIMVVRLFLEKGFNKASDDVWKRCKTQEMVSLLIQHGQEIYNPQKNINAVSDAVIADRDYIEYLLTQYSQAAKGTPETRPLFSASFSLAPNAQRLRKLLIDFGASPYEGLNWGNKLNPLQWLRKQSSNVSPWSQVHYEAAQWMQQYYHVRKDLIPLVFESRRRLLRNRFTHNGKTLPEEVIDMIL